MFGVSNPLIVEMIVMSMVDVDVDIDIDFQLLTSKVLTIAYITHVCGFVSSQISIVTVKCPILPHQHLRYDMEL